MHWFLIISTVLVMPFVYIKSAIDPALLPRFLFLSVVLLISTVHLLVNVIKKDFHDEYHITRHKVFIIMGIYVLVTVISITSAINISEAIFDTMRILLGINLLIIGSIIFTKYENSINIFRNAIVVCSFISCIIGLCQYYEIAFQSISGASTITSTLANKNIFTSLLCISFPFTLYGLQSSSKLWKIFNLLTAVLILFIIVISQTRASWVAFTVALILTSVIYLVWSRKHRIHTVGNEKRRLNYKPFLIVLMIIVIIAGAGILSQNSYQKTITRAKSIFDPQQPSNKIRLTLWDNSITMFSENPLFGVGPGNWKINAAKFGPVGTARLAENRFYQRPHNDYLWILSESGIIALASYLLIILFVFVYAFRAIFTFNDKKKAMLTILLLFALTAYLVDAIFSFPRERIVLLSYSMLIMAAIISLYHRSSPRKKRTRRGVIVSILSLTLLISITAVYVGSEKLYSEIHTNKAMGWRASSRWENVIREIDIAQSRFYTMDPTTTPLSWYRGEANFMLTRYKQAFQDYSDAYRVNPNHMHVLNNLASSYEMQGAHDEAIKLYQKTLMIYPAFDDALINLAAVYYNTGHYQNALLTIERVSQKCDDSRLPLFRQKIEEKMISPK